MKHLEETQETVARVTNWLEIYCRKIYAHLPIWVCIPAHPDVMRLQEIAKI